MSIWNFVRATFIKFLAWVDHATTERRVQVIGGLFGAVLALIGFIVTLIYPDTFGQIQGDTSRTATATEEIARTASDLRNDLAEDSAALLDTVEGGKREISEDPIIQLANYGYPLSRFNSGQELFLRAKSDGARNVMLTALQANVRLSPEILTEHRFPAPIWPALASHKNWADMQSLCEVIKARAINLRQLETKMPENFVHIQQLCADATSAVLRLEDREQQASDIRAAEIEAVASARRQEQAREDEEVRKERERLAAQRSQERAIRTDSLNRTKAACRQYYESSEWERLVKQTLIRFILENGEYWNGLPDFKVPEGESGYVYLDDDYIQNVDWLLGYTRANFGVLNGELVMAKPPTSKSRFRTVPEAIAGNLRNYGELKCQQLVIRSSG